MTEPVGGDVMLESVGWMSFGRGDPPSPVLRFFAKEGTLRLVDGRLSFTTRRGVVVFDEPLGALHSVAPSELGAGLDVWSGPVRHRIVFPGTSDAIVVSNAPGVMGVVDAAAGFEQSVRAHRGAKRVVEQWLEVLGDAVAAEAPAGVRVRRPRTGALFVLTMVLKLFVAAAAIGGAVVAAVLLL
ncbi:MAG: hypothetical protein JJU45_00360 [Acidimicrobiia bacterium]|nr:hypothetical protein [Acidimicrobiia bacterium]